MQLDYQKLFEQQLELLIGYKKCNLDKDVYLSLDSLEEAVKWYQNFCKSMNPDMIKKLKHNKSVFNRFVREDPSMQYTKLHKLYEKPWIDIGLNPLLDEIYLDK